MSYDVVALVAENPDIRTLTKALEDAGPELGVRASSGGHLLRLHDAQGMLLTLEPAQLVEAPTEVERLLGPDLLTGLPERFWWTELRARPDDTGRRAAHRVADRLALRPGGAVWTSGRGDFGLWEETEHPAVEYVARRAVVVAQDREVVPFSSWIADALAVQAERGGGFQLLTPASARLTHALRGLMARPFARWVVRTRDGDHFDGVTGLPLRWDPEHGHVPIRPKGSATPVEDFLDEAPMGRQLVVDAAVRHPEPGFVPGRLVESLTESLTNSRPLSWGPHEPALTPWDRNRLLRLIRHRSPRSTLVRFQGHGFSGDLRVTSERGTVREQVSLVLGYEDEAPLPYDALPTAVAASMEGLEVMQVRRARGRVDRTYAPRWHGLSEPVGLAVGPEPVGASEGSRGPIEGVPVGEGTWFPVPVAMTGERGRRLMTAQLRHLQPKA